MPKCGDCKIFNPKLGVNPAKPDQEWFNCTSAKIMGSPMGMQVRADTNASKCKSFVQK